MLCTNQMSLEDLDLDFLSDESDCESETSLSDDEKEDDDVGYLDLVYLHNNLMCFHQIYNNNAIIDSESLENGDWPSFDSLGSELAFIWDQLDIDTPELAFLYDALNGAVEHTSSTSSSSPSSAEGNEDGTSPDSADSVPNCVPDFELYEEVVSTSSTSSPESEVYIDAQMTNAEHTND